MSRFSFSVFRYVVSVLPLFFENIIDKLFYGRRAHGGVTPGDVEYSRHPVLSEPYAGFVQLGNKGF